MQVKIGDHGISCDLDRVDLLNIRDKIPQMTFLDIDGENALCIYAFRSKTDKVRAGIADPRKMIEVVEQ